MTILLALIALLHAKGVGALGTDIYAVPVTGTPTGDQGFLTVEETGGAAPLGTQGDPTALRRPGFQLVARQGKNYGAAGARADVAFDALASVTNVEIGGVFFLWIRATQDVFSLGLDPSGRPRAAFNVTALCRILPT